MLYSKSFRAGLIAGLLLGLLCIHTGMQQARDARPNFPVITTAP